MRIGVYVGSFNPVHKGHKDVIDYLIDNNYVDKVIVISTGNYWDKDRLIDVRYRVEMFRKYSNDNIIVDNTLNNIPYTYLVLRELNNKYSNDSMYLIIGADNIIKFDLWKNVDEIIDNNYVLILPRNGILIDEYINNFDKNYKFIIVDKFREVNISSSVIRNLIKDNNKEELLKYLDSSIIDYIFDNKLYQ